MASFVATRYSINAVCAAEFFRRRMAKTPMQRLRPPRKRARLRPAALPKAIACSKPSRKGNWICWRRTWCLTPSSSPRYIRTSEQTDRRGLLPGHRHCVGGCRASQGPPDRNRACRVRRRDGKCGHSGKRQHTACDIHPGRGRGISSSGRQASRTIGEQPAVSAPAVEVCANLHGADRAGPPSPVPVPP